MSRAKQLIVEGMWLETQQLTVCLDGRLDGVELPPSLRGDPTVTLAYTEDIHIGDSGVRATLAFDHVLSETFVPWDALYQVASDAGHVVFVESVPAVIMCQVAEKVFELPPEPPPPPRERPSWLTLVP